MKEHHFIVKWSKRDGWQIDPDTESANFPNGTVWNEATSEWDFDDYDNGLIDQLRNILRERASESK